MANEKLLLDIAGLEVLRQPPTRKWVKIEARTLFLATTCLWARDKLHQEVWYHKDEGQGQLPEQADLCQNSFSTLNDPW